MIGYYVHHHGRGHRQRMESIAAHLSTPLTVLSSLRPEGLEQARPWITLPLDQDGPSRDVTAGGTLHWAPLHHPGLRRRMAAITAWIESAAPVVMVVDVSVEVAVLARLTGTPVVVVGMPGDRCDPAHRLGYDLATAILAPWAAEFTPVEWPQSWRDKTFHAGGISRWDGRPPPERRVPSGPLRVAVLWGTGGGTRPEALEALTADFLVRSMSPQDTVDDVFDLLAWCDVAVAHAGQNVVAELAATRTPAVVIAEPRPHGEQVATSRRLQTAGIAVTVETLPSARAWPELLGRAHRAGGSGWSRWSPGDGARAAAQFLDALAVQLGPPASAHHG